LGSHIFTAEKFTVSVEHDKLLSQLVLHGNEQDTLLYPVRSSPTIAFHTIMMALAIVARNVDCILGKLDIKGAFIQTEMSDMPVYIRCTGQPKY
jgi:hypothetical protein